MYIIITEKCLAGSFESEVTKTSMRTCSSLEKARKLLKIGREGVEEVRCSGHALAATEEIYRTGRRGVIYRTLFEMEEGDIALISKRKYGYY